MEGSSSKESREAGPDVRGIAPGRVEGARASPRSPGPSHDYRGAPRLAGQLLTEPRARRELAGDLGGIVSLVPGAVLQPGSPEDIARMVAYCRRHHVKVAARGQGHTTFGQSQVDGGLAIDMRGLSRIRLEGEDRVAVGAGATWSRVLDATAAHGLTPPVLTGFLGLSVGGTLSVGGLGAMSHRLGAQIDHVIELSVVTGAGELARCSPEHDRELFDAALAGLGQCAVLVGATLRLVPAPPRVRCFILSYDAAPDFFADLAELSSRGALDTLAGSMLPGAGGRWVYQITAGKYFSPPEQPSAATLFEGVRCRRRIPAQDVPYVQFHRRFDVLIQHLEASVGFQGVTRPWFDVLLPGSTARQSVERALESLTPDDVGPTGFVLLCPVRRSPSPRPLLRLPDEERSFLFHVLTSAPSPGASPAFASRMLARNRRLFEAARDAGGVLYPIGSVPMARADWARHYGEAWSALSSWKQGYDPDAILTPGPGIF
jgi:cytokinin dehydrogenase